MFFTHNVVDGQDNAVDVEATIQEEVIHLTVVIRHIVVMISLSLIAVIFHIVVILLIVVMRI